MLSEGILTFFTYVLLMKLGGIDKHQLHTCKMEGGGRIGACPWWEGVGARGPCPPPPQKMKKKRLPEEIFTAFTYVLLIKQWGLTYTTCMQNGKGWADRRLSMVGGGGGLAPPPLENEKKILSEEILTSFTYVLLMKLEGAIDTLYRQNERGWADMRLSLVGGGGRGGFAPLENEKKELRISATECGGGKQKNYICVMRGQNDYPADIQHLLQQKDREIKKGPCCYVYLPMGGGGFFIVECLFATLFSMWWQFWLRFCPYGEVFSQFKGLFCSFFPCRGFFATFASLWWSFFRRLKAFLPLFLLCGGAFYYVFSPYVELFSLFEGPFATFFSFWGTFLTI